MKQEIKKIIQKAVGQNVADFSVGVPGEKSHGEYSTNIALVLAKKLNKNPREVAEQIKEKIGVNKLFKKIESVISHEMNHLFDQYMRRLNKSKGFEVGLTWASIEGENLYDLPNSIVSYWKDNFTNWIYEAEPHEVNAQTQEAYSYVKKMTFDKFRKSRYFNNAKIMQNWSSINFINNFKKIIKEEGLDPDETIEKVRKTFIGRYKDIVKNNNEYPDLDPWKLDKYSPEKFWKIFERKIKKSGTILIRNYCRLFANKQYD